MNLTFNKRHFRYRKGLPTLAKQNRKQATKAEGLMWNLILRKKRTGYRFLRQKTINKYILDFYCAKLMFGIEIDGSSHDFQDEKDKAREVKLLTTGIKIIRYANEQIENNAEGVYYDVLRQIELRKRELLI